VKAPWWLGLAPAVAEIDCGARRHRLQWAAGRLHAIDHGDAEAEEALAVLGGDRPPCLAVVHAWRTHSTAVQLVTLGRRPGEGPIGFPVGTVPPPGRVLGDGDGDENRPDPRVLRQHPDVADILRLRHASLALLSLPGPLVDRLVLTAMASCAERWGDEAFRAEHGLRIGAALSVRAAPALRRFGGRLGRGEPTVTVSPSQPHSGPTLTARLEPGQPVVVDAELPVAWLVDVWGRGISEPDGQLVLGVRDADESGRELLVDVAEWEPAGPITWELAAVPARLVLDDGRWTVAAVAGGAAPAT
jgi:hypothetical protein